MESDRLVLHGPAAGMFINLHPRSRPVHRHILPAAHKSFQSGSWVATSFSTRSLLLLRTFVHVSIFYFILIFLIPDTHHLLFHRFTGGHRCWSQWRNVPAFEDCVHQHPTPGAGEGVPFQQISVQTEASGDRRLAGFNREAGEGVVPEQEDEAQKADPLQGKPRQWGKIRLPGRRSGGRVRAGGGRQRGRDPPGEGEAVPAKPIHFTAMSEREQWGEPKPECSPFEQQWEKSETFSKRGTHCSKPRVNNRGGQWSFPGTGPFLAGFPCFLILLLFLTEFFRFYREFPAFIIRNIWPFLRNTHHYRPAELKLLNISPFVHFKHLAMYFVVAPRNKLLDPTK